MNPKSEKLLLKDEVFQVVGCSAMVSWRSRTKTRWSSSFCCGKFRSSSNPRLMWCTKVRRLAPLFPNLIAFNSLVVDTKVIERISDHERGLMLNYLRITGMRVGVILNFKHSKLEWQRIAL
jgi:hypothetical protein